MSMRAVKDDGSRGLIGIRGERPQWAGMAVAALSRSSEDPSQPGLDGEAGDVAARLSDGELLARAF